MGRRRPKKKEGRIDGIIDNLAQYGFPRTQIRKTVNDLLQVAACSPSKNLFFFFASCNPLACMRWFMIFAIHGSQYSVILLSCILAFLHS